MVSTKKSPTTFPARLFAIRERRQRSPGTLQTEGIFLILNYGTRGWL